MTLGSMTGPMTPPASRRTLCDSRRLAAVLLVGTLLLCGGCLHHLPMIPVDKQRIIDRRQVEYPSGFGLVLLVDGLDEPTALAIDDDGSLVVAESGSDGREPHIFGYHRDGSYFQIYPFRRDVSFFPRGFVLYGPIGGMVVRNHIVYLSHREKDGTGTITALGYDGSHATIKANLPAQGDYGLTDLAISPIDNRLYFGIGTATNSGVVGVDNWNEGWLKRFGDVHDLPYAPGPALNLLGRRFDTPNPRSGLFGPGDIAVTAPFQQFGVSNQTRIPGSDTPNGAVMSIPLDGGETRVEAFGLHNPRGISFDEYGTPYVTNDGMELRGTRPVKNDPDTLLRVSRGIWYGWPDYTTDLQPVSDSYFQPPLDMIIKSGYPDLSYVIDHDASGLHPPRPSDVVAGRFPSLSGASKFVFAPASGPLKKYNGDAIVTLSGWRGTFATSGQKLTGLIGFKVVLVNRDTRQVRDFIRNTAGVPQNQLPFGTVALERPIDVKIGPDGTLYLLDFGRMEDKAGEPRYWPGTGRIFKLVPLPETPATSSVRAGG